MTDATGRAGRRVVIPRRIAADDLTVPGPDAARFSLGGETMGTSWSAVFYAPAGFTPGHVAADLERTLQRTIDQMSLWESGSDIARFNAAAPGVWITLPEPFFSVLAEALEIAGQTGGAFDPCLADLSELWGFGPGGARGEAPDEASLTAAKARAGWRALELDRAGKRVRQPGGAALDLNAIAKGDAVDRLAETLNGHGLKSWLVEIGGELRGRGLKPDRTPWWTALETGPEPAAQADSFVAAVSGLAVASSGGYRRAFEAGGAHHCHVIDAETGQAIRPRLSSVTVFAPTCARADALATALFAMGAERGLAFADDGRIAALFAADGASRPSAALAEMLDDDPPETMGRERPPGTVNL